MSKRAKEKAERIANGIMISVQGKTGRVVYNTKEKSFTHYELMCAAQKGYEQAEKDTVERIISYLGECDLERTILDFDSDGYANIDFESLEKLIRKAMEEE